MALGKEARAAAVEDAMPTCVRGAKRDAADLMRGSTKASIVATDHAHQAALRRNGTPESDHVIFKVWAKLPEDDVVRVDEEKGKCTFTMRVDDSSG